MWTDGDGVGKPDQKSPYIENYFVFPSAHTIFAQSDYFTDCGNMVNHTHLPRQYQSKWLLMEIFGVWIFPFSYFSMTNLPLSLKSEITLNLAKCHRQKLGTERNNEYVIAAGYFKQKNFTTNKSMQIIEKSR